MFAFGNMPYFKKLTSIRTEDTPFRDQAQEYCNTGVAVYGGARTGPGNHDSYQDDGSVQRAAAVAAARVPPGPAEDGSPT